MATTQKPKPETADNKENRKASIKLKSRTMKKLRKTAKQQSQIIFGSNSMIWNYLY